jgi:hypothetical protein
VAEPSTRRASSEEFWAERPISAVIEFISTIVVAVWTANDEKFSVFVATS